jgi:hypothetical protein
MSLDTDKIKKPKKKEPRLTSKVSDLLLAGMSASNIIEKLSDTSAKNPHKKETIRDVIRDLKANNPQKKLNRGTFSGNPQGSGDMDGPYFNQMKDGGEVKKYMGGGSVHKNKNKMITKRGWGASRKT